MEFRNLSDDDRIKYLERVCLLSTEQVDWLHSLLQFKIDIEGSDPKYMSIEYLSEVECERDGLQHDYDTLVELIEEIPGRDPAREPHMQFLKRVVELLKVDNIFGDD